MEAAEEVGVGGRLCKGRQVSGRRCRRGGGSLSHVLPPAAAASVVLLLQSLVTPCRVVSHHPQCDNALGDLPG